MNINLTDNEAVYVHHLLQILPLLNSAIVTSEAKQNLIQQAVEDENLKCIAQRFELELRSNANQLDSAANLPEAEFDLAATLDRLIEQQRSCDYERGWVLFQLQDEEAIGFAIDFAALTQEQWKLIADKLGFRPGWAWHQHQTYSKLGEG